MSKWMIVALILMIVLTGCNGLEVEGTDDQNMIEMQYNYSAEDIYMQDIKIVDFMKLNEEQALERLGGEYEIFRFSHGNDEEYEEEYYFPKYFLFLTFDEEGLPDTIQFAKGADLMGVTMDSNASEIKAVMGKGELIETDNANFPFALIYRYEGFALWFYLTEANGDVFGIDVYFYQHLL